MPLTPATTDLFQKVGLPGSATTLASPGFTIGNTGITVGSTTNHPTDTLYTFAIDRAQTVNGVTSRIAGTYCEFEGIVASGTTITSMVLKYGTSQNYPAGSFTRVYIPVSSNRENQLIVGLRQDHNGKGNHQTLTDDNANPWLGRNQVAAAVNYPQVTNAATGGIPRVDAIGGDTNIPLYLGAKGSEVAHAENPELISNFILSGTGAVAISSGLIGTFANITYYISGKRYKKSSIANKTYTASKDTYIDIDTSGNITYTEQVNGTTPPALAANNIRVARVVTNGTAITLIEQYGRTNTVPVFPTAPARPFDWWEELARVTLTAGGATSVTTPNFVPKKYLRVIFFAGLTNAWGSGQIRFNGDSGNNYTYRLSSNGGADSTGLTTGVPVDTGATGTGAYYLELDVMNYAALEKLLVGMVTDGGNGTGTGNVTGRREVNGKWANATTVITSVTIVVTGGSTATFGQGSELIILGHD